MVSWQRRSIRKDERILQQRGVPDEDPARIFLSTSLHLCAIHPLCERIDQDRPIRSGCASPPAKVRGDPGACLQLAVDYHPGRKHLPIVTLKPAA
jgi:hypothetical protein